MIEVELTKDAPTAVRWTIGIVAVALTTLTAYGLMRLSPWLLVGHFTLASTVTQWKMLRRN